MHRGEHPEAQEGIPVAHSNDGHTRRGGSEPTEDRLETGRHVRQDLLRALHIDQDPVEAGVQPIVRPDVDGDELDVPPMRLQESHGLPELGTHLVLADPTLDHGVGGLAWTPELGQAKAGDLFSNLAVQLVGVSVAESPDRFKACCRRVADRDVVGRLGSGAGAGRAGGDRGQHRDHQDRPNG